jgi:hypothetical protein
LKTQKKNFFLCKNKFIKEENDTFILKMSLTAFENAFTLDPADAIDDDDTAEDISDLLQNVLFTGSGGSDKDECRKKMVFECGKDVDDDCSWRGGLEGCVANDDSIEQSNWDVVHHLMLPLVSNMPEVPIPGQTIEVVAVRSQPKKVRSSRTSRSKSRSASKKTKSRSAPIPVTKSRSRRSRPRKSRSKRSRSYV